MTRSHYRSFVAEKNTEMEAGNPSRSEDIQSQSSLPVRTTELIYPPTQNPMTDVASTLPNSQTASMPEVSKQTTSTPEIGKHQEYLNARFIYKSALKACRNAIDGFENKQYFNLAYDDLPSSNIRQHFHKVQQREQVLKTAAQDLLLTINEHTPSNEKAVIEEDLNSIASQMLAFKFIYEDNISETAVQNHQDSEKEPPFPAYTETGSNPLGIWTLGSLQSNTTPITTSPNPQRSSHQTSTVNVIAGRISSVLPPSLPSNPHWHTVMCTSKTCTSQSITQSRNGTNHTELSRETSRNANLQQIPQDRMNTYLSTVKERMEEMFISLQMENQNLKSEFAQFRENCLRQNGSQASQKRVKDLPMTQTLSLSQDLDPDQDWELTSTRSLSWHLGATRIRVFVFLPLWARGIQIPSLRTA